MKDCSKLIIYKIGDHLLQDGASILILKEQHGDRYLPIIIGGSEAKSIILALEKIPVPRPLTHTLFVDFMTAVKCSLQSVVIYRFTDSIYYAQLHFINETGDLFAIESRTSDAIAIAVRCNAPIYAKEEVMETTGITASQIDDSMEEKEKSQKEDEDSEFSDYFDFELQQMLQDAVDEENYEAAARIRDEINKRLKQ
jgi:bifunctional DNase/RNase